MKLTTRCKTCKTEVSFVSSVNDRVELEMQKGKVIPLTCKNDGHKHKYHVNELRAEKSLSMKVISFGFSFIIILAIVFLGLNMTLTGLLFYSQVFIAPTGIYMLIHKQQQKRLNSFNRFKVKE